MAVSRTLSDLEAEIKQKQDELNKRRELQVVDDIFNDIKNGKSGDNVYNWLHVYREDYLRTYRMVNIKNRRTTLDGTHNALDIAAMSGNEKVVIMYLNHSKTYGEQYYPTITKDIVISPLLSEETRKRLAELQFRFPQARTREILGQHCAHSCIESINDVLNLLGGSSGTIKPAELSVLANLVRAMMEYDSQLLSKLYPKLISNVIAHADANVLYTLIQLQVVSPKLKYIQDYYSADEFDRGVRMGSCWGLISHSDVLDQLVSLFVKDENMLIDQQDAHDIIISETERYRDDLQRSCHLVSILENAGLVDWKMFDGNAIPGYSTTYIFDKVDRLISNSPLVIFKDNLYCVGEHVANMRRLIAVCHNEGREKAILSILNAGNEVTDFQRVALKIILPHVSDLKAILLNANTAEREYIKSILLNQPHTPNAKAITQAVLATLNIPKNLQPGILQPLLSSKNVDWVSLLMQTDAKQFDSLKQIKLQSTNGVANSILGKRKSPGAFFSKQSNAQQVVTRAAGYNLRPRNNTGTIK